MTTLNFALSRAAGREFRSGDEIVVTRLDHDANVAPWLELARDRDLLRAVRGHRRGGLHARARRPRAPALGPDAGRRLPVGLECGRDGDGRPAHRGPRARGGRARLDRRRALRAARPHRRGRRRRRRPHLLAVQVLRPAPGALLRPGGSARAIHVRTRCGRLPTSPSRTASRRARCRTRRSQASWRRSSTSSRSAGTRSRRTSASSGSASSPGCPRECGSTGFRPWTAGRRRSRSRSSRTPRMRSRRTSPSANRGLVGELLRPRDHGAARAPGRRRPDRLRPLQHRRRGRPASRRAPAADSMSVHLWWAQNDGMSGHVWLGPRGARPAPPGDAASGDGRVVSGREARARGRVEDHAPGDRGRPCRRGGESHGAPGSEAMARLARIPGRRPPQGRARPPRSSR